MIRGRSAVVLGGSVAGLCSAGVLANHFDEVLVLERDQLPADAEHRRGVPQSKHPHFLLNSGRTSIGAIFPGFEEAMLEAGGRLLMPSMDAAYCDNGGWAPRKQSTMTMVYSSRIMIERVLRDKVRALTNIRIVEGASVTGLVTADGGTSRGRVTGITWRDADGTDQVVEADFIVDALGRGSSVPEWLVAAGWDAVPERTLDAKVTYTSRWYQLPPVEHRPDSWWWKHLVIMPTQDAGDHPEEYEYLSNFFPIEGDTVIVCMGSWGLEMARKPEAFEASAGRVRASAFGAAMRACTPLSEVHLTRSTGNKWRRYDELANPPVGLVAIGDSICAFNPFYAQGMSSAARSALLLREKLEKGATIDADFHRRYLKAQKKSLDVPWMLAMARDQVYDCATGTETVAAWRRALASKASWPIFNTINAASREDRYVEETFAAVFNLDKSLKEMMTDPRFLWGLVRYKVRERLGRTIVPGGFDELEDPPGTDWTDPVRAAAESRTAELVES